MTTDHPLWDNFIEYLSGSLGSNTRLEFGKLTWDCDHSMRFPLSHYLLEQYSGLDRQATIAWFIEQQWWCDCEVVFYSDATPMERRIGLKKSINKFS
jgi:hypothetical protein